ncbi:hypothetical protein [Litoribrevibacter albus]|uniref:Uncharacterized protein n=1 Tax=Litoribrevibacter albus TaxID=1473156 RepID=A0AA37W7I7_9GAMM|nr:hypothetical protein [Litoribrevibacter albus]GLQ32665.1 hypothetical protein GCM10007876_31440 [Litoribrevibacter albus]
MKTITSALCTIVLASFATFSVAQEVQQPGFTSVDQATPTCKYVKKADRKRDLDCMQ